MAVHSPEYTHHAIMYQLFLRGFTPEGTINAAAKLLPHLADIGIDIVYLCPITTADDDMDKVHWSKRQLASGLENPCNPYRVKDYFDIDPEYGDDDDLLAFVKTAHQLGMAVILDVVYWHCGPKANIIAEHPDFVKRDENGELLYNIYNFAVLDFDNPDLREYLYENLEYFVEKFGVDGYRADVAGAIPADFWNEARRRLDEINPDITMLAESEEPALHEDAFDMSYAFCWSRKIAAVFDGKEPATTLRDIWHDLNERMKDALPRFIRCFDNHDICSDDYDNRTEKRWSQDANDAALLLDFTIDGIPFVYNGQEIADATRISIWSNRFHSHSQCINWSKLLTSEGQARLDFFKKLTELRHSSDVLAEGDTIWVDNSTPDELISFLRVPAPFVDDDDDVNAAEDDDCGCDDCGCDDHETPSSVLVVINASDKPLASTLEFGLERGMLLKVCMIRGANYKPDGDQLKVNLLPYGFLVLEF